MKEKGECAWKVVVWRMGLGRGLYAGVGLAPESKVMGGRGGARLGAAADRSARRRLRLRG